MVLLANGFNHFGCDEFCLAAKWGWDCVCASNWVCFFFFFKKGKNFWDPSGKLFNWKYGWLIWLFRLFVTCNLDPFSFVRRSGRGEAHVTNKWLKTLNFKENINFYHHQKTHKIFFNGCFDIWREKKPNLCKIFLLRRYWKEITWEREPWRVRIKKETGS